MLYSNYILLIVGVFLLRFSDGEEKIETYCNINGERALQYVSEKFLSISIDPAVLLAGLNLSDSSLLLAQHLSPAYIRIAGPSTKFVQYKDNEDKSTDRLSEDGNNVVVTPSMWFGINEWLRLANLTPVFGINDIETTREVWNPKSTLPLLEISDKLNVSCYWQLGFDSFRKTETQYKQDLSVLYHLLTAFPERNETWKIVGSDISTLPKEHTENTMEELKDIVTAVMWEPREVTEESFPEKDMGWKILRQQHKPNVKIWTSVPKSSETISFSSALLWAMQVGEAAKFGYEVVFRQPRLHEIFSDTPAYWFSLLHKKLMGSNVLDVKTPVYYPGSAAYAHCTRKQNDSGKGSVTVMIVNNNLQKYRTKVKLGTTAVEKSMEVLSYILTSSAENSTDIYLNGKKLTTDFLSEGHSFEPKQRKTKSKSYISLEVPPQSIGFFVLPEAEVPICVNKENEATNLSREMLGEQNAPLSEETVLNLASRGTFVQNPTLQEMAQKMKKEMQSDERFYKTNSELEELNKKSDSIEDTTKAGRKSLIEKAKLAAKQRKNSDLEKRKEELRKFLLERTKPVDVQKPETRMETKSKNLDLTSDEVEKILKDRAKARAAQRNIIFTDDELDALLQKSSKQFLKSKFKKPVGVDNSRRKRDINMEVLDRQLELDSSEEETEYFQEINKQYSQNRNKRPERSPRDINMKLLDFRTKLEDNRQRLEDKKYEILGNTQTIKENIKDKIRNLKHKNRYRRDINMDLLKIKTEGQKKALQRDEQKKPKRLFKHKVDKEATIRKPDQTSDELLGELEEEEDISIEQQVMPKVEVYAELANPEEEEMEEDNDFFNMNTKPKKAGIFDRKPIVNPTSYTFKKGKKEKNTFSDNLQFLTTSEEFTDIEEDLPCIHEFFGSDFKDTDGTKKKKVVHELGETRMSERKYKKVKNSNRKMAELGDIMSDEKDLFEELRMKRDTQDIKYISNDLSDVKKTVNEKLRETVEESKLFQYGIEEIDLDDLDDVASSEDQSIPENSYVLKESESIETKMDNEMNKKPDQPLNEDKAVQSILEERQSLEDNTGTSKISLSVSDEDENQFTKHVDQKLDHQSEDASSGSESLMVKDIEEKELESSNLRKKRNAEQILEANDGAHKKGIHLDVTQLIENDKLKLEERRMKNKQKLADFKRKKEEDIAKHKEDIVGEIHQIEKEKRSELLEQLQSLKAIISQRKKDLDKSIVKDRKLHQKLELENRKKKVPSKYSSSNNMSKENSKTEIERKNDKIEDTQIKTSLIRRLRKRALFDKYPGGFGSYKPLTPKLKSWRPSDILSLKRDDSLLNSRNLKPTNDYQLYTNMFDQNRYSSFKKRSIGSNLNDLENYIDKDVNTIEKDTAYIPPKLIINKSNDMFVANIDLNKSEKEKIKKNHDTVEVLSKEKKEETGTTMDPIIYYTFDGDFGTEIQSDVDTVTERIFASSVGARTADVDEQGQRIFKNFVSNVSGFFKEIGSKIEHYVRSIGIF